MLNEKRRVKTTMTNKSAQLSESLHSIQGAFLLSEIQERWSPRVFTEETVSESHLHLLLEAARWAPSCMNEQPWRFLVYGRDHETRTQIESYLGGGNYWAKKASHLIVACAHTRFSGSDAPNRHAYYDTGAAVFSLTLQAQSLGISVHQMAGFDHEQLATDLAFPEHAHAVTMVAIGHPSHDISSLSEKHQTMEKAPRQRKTIDSIVRQNTVSIDGLF
jgi:nitroreductase